MCGQPAQELHALDGRAADLEVERARAADRAAAEQRPPEICPATTRPAGDALRRLRQRRVSRREHARLPEKRERGRVAGDAQLVARRLAECALAVGAELRAGAELAEEAKRSAGDGRAA